MRTLVFVVALAFAVAAMPRTAGADPLSGEILAPHTKTFTIEGGAFVGPGAEVLLRAIEESAAVLLGEYHGSVQIAAFTEALVPKLHDAGCRTMILEIGPNAQGIVSESLDDHGLALTALGLLNQRFGVETPDGFYAPIPFVGGVEDAAFIQSAHDHGWELAGIDQEFVFGYRVVLRELAGAVGVSTEVDAGFLAADAAVEEAFELDAKDGPSAAVTLTDSVEFQAFLDRAARVSDEAAATVADVRTSLEIYRLNDEGDWWQSNGTRIGHMKTNLGRALDRLGLTIGPDRVFLKMGAVHTGRGLSLLRYHEIGSTIAELAELQGERSVHLACMSRYWVAEGSNEPADALADGIGYAELVSMGVSDAWTIIDLRPLRQAVLYDWIETERFTKEYITQHDLVLIPPADWATTHNMADGGGGWAD
ncbi:MAG: hypothetical protein AAGB51_12620 [Planctomycetota bacterium]